MLFPSICDVIRNLSGMWKMMFPDVYSKYFDVPQTTKTKSAASFYENEMAEFRQRSGRNCPGARSPIEDLRNSIAGLQREPQADTQALRSARRKTLAGAGGGSLSRGARRHGAAGRRALATHRGQYLAAVENEDRPVQATIAASVVTGMFCEQPPLNLIKSLELSGCYVVDDDLMLVTRWLIDDVPTDGDPLHNLSQAFLHHSEARRPNTSPTLKKRASILVRAVQSVPGPRA